MIDADSRQTGRGWARWRPAHWPTVRTAVVAIGFGLVSSVAVLVATNLVLGRIGGAAVPAGLADRLAVAAMLPFVLLALPRHIPDAAGDRIRQPLWRAGAFVVTAFVLWGGLVVAVAPTGAQHLALTATDAAFAVPLLGVTIMQATTEELLFRLLLPLVLVRAFGRSPYGAVAATLVSALLFGVFHVPDSAASFLDHVLFALLMHQVLGATRTIAVPVLLHVVNNVIAQSFGALEFAPENSPNLLVAKYLIFFSIAAAVFPSRSAWPASAWTQRFASHEAARVERRQAVRLPAVDALRGVALLFIMLENLLIYLPAESVTAGTSVVERAIRAALAVLIEYRGLPLYALLLGFGMYVLLRRADSSQRRAAVVRRNLSLILLGALHGMLVFSGDILAVYGILLYVLVWATRKPRRLRLATWASGVLFLLQTLVLPFTLLLTAGDEATASVLADSASVALGARWTEWLLYVLSTPFLSSGLLFPMLVGYRSAAVVLRDRSAGDRPTSRSFPLVVVLLVGSFTLCLPYAAVLAEHWGDIRAVAAHPWHLVAAQIGGLLGALACWWAIAEKWTGLRASSGVRILATLGQRSLTLYLLHSIVFLLLLTPPFGGLATAGSLPILALVVVLGWVGAGLALSSRRLAGIPMAEELLRDMAAGPVTGSDEQAAGAAERVKEPI
ncbi:CPBP family glutamic-type intramembrane protease [Micromonospora taraxaci]|uniref:CPBP family glutamic-type intramembrane protease n=1 Tax=Micromonospora taraxaci TaxID=1316803 RepID=UPI0033D34D19